MDYVLGDHDEKIWRVWPIVENTSLLIEVRNESKREIRLDFYSIIDNYTVPVRLPSECINYWWLQVIKNVGNYILFSAFDSNVNPITKGVFIYDFLSQEWIFQNNEVLLENVDIIGDKVKVTFKSNFNKEELNLPLKINGHVNYSEQEYQYLIEGEGRYNDIASLIFNDLQENICGPVEYLETENKLIIGFHTQKEKQIKAHVVLWNEKGDIIGNETIHNELKGWAANLFQYISSIQKIVFIKDNNRIKLI